MFIINSELLCCNIFVSFCVLLWSFLLIQKIFPVTVSVGHKATLSILKNLSASSTKNLEIRYNHKVHIYLAYHSVCPLGRPNWDPPLPQASVSLPRNQRGGGAGDTHSPAGEGVGEPQFRRLEKKPSTLSTLWIQLQMYDSTYLHPVGLRWVGILLHSKLQIITQLPYIGT